jgi:hypothetical protein
MRDERRFRCADNSRSGRYYLTSHHVFGRVRVLHQQRRSLHNLAGLAKAALRHVDLAPSLLDRMVAGRVKAFNSSDVAARYVGHRRNTGANGFLVGNDRASAAERLTATVFGTR